MSKSGDIKYTKLTETVGKNFADLSSTFSKIFNSNGESSDKTELPSSSTETDKESRINSWLIKSELESSFTLLTHKQRMIGFTFCVFFSALCLCLMFLISPIILTRSGMRKAVFLNTLGSISLLLSFSFFWGPMSHLKSLFSAKNIYFTLCFLSSLMFSLYAVIIRRSALLSLFGMSIQDAVLLYQVLKWIPGGIFGARYLAKAVYATLSGAAMTVLPK